MQFDFILKPTSETSVEDFLVVRGRRLPMTLHRNPRARRYLLRLRPDGSARVTIPRGGSLTEARRFAERNTIWLEQQLQRLAEHPVLPTKWSIGTEILFRGNTVKIATDGNEDSNMIRFDTEILKVMGYSDDLRPTIERHLWMLANHELPAKVYELAALHGLTVSRITVRNQRSRWGSCSRRGTISLNWRLIQTPPFVQDYIAIHEIMHLREMNHSSRFWREVEHACPDYEIAERWLKQHSSLLK